MQGSEDFIARGIGQDAHRDAVADAVGFAPDIAFDRLAFQHAAGVDDEGLTLLDRAALARRDRTRSRAGGKKGVARFARNALAVGRPQARLETEVATLARLQRAFERRRPAARVAPAPLALDRAAIDDEGRRRIGRASATMSALNTALARTCWSIWPCGENWRSAAALAGVVIRTQELRGRLSHNDFPSRIRME